MAAQEKAEQQTSVAKYISMLKNFEQKNHDDLMELFKQFKVAEGRPKENLKNQIVLSNLRLVVSIAKQYRNHKMPIEDLIQEGNIGLMKAVDRFDYTRGFAFSTYAIYWIRQSINQHILKTKKLIRLPAHAVAVQRKILQRMHEVRKNENREISNEELVETLGESKTVVRATLASGKPVVSLYEPAIKGSVRHVGRETLLIDNIVDDAALNSFNKIVKNELMETIQKVFESLSFKEAAVIRMRCGLDNDLEQNEEQENYEEDLD